MAKKTIDRFSLRYTMTKLYARLAYRIFFRKIQSKFSERIPGNRPVILALNHQNALMDAVIPHMTSRRDLVFLTRADVFKSKVMAGIFRLFKMLPIYRIRDGASELAKNEEVFNESIEVLLRKKSPIGIMPEGNHGDKRRLRPLVKGIFRIAFQAQESFGENPGVVIVPVGMDYSSYTNFRGNIFIQYGEPVEVSEYYAEYKENQPRALNLIRERLATEMKKYIIHIQSEEHYDTYMLLRQVYNRRMRERMGFRKKDLYHRLLADQQMIRELTRIEEEQPEKMSSLSELGSEYIEGVNKLNMRDWIFGEKNYSVSCLILAILGMLLLLPAFLYGAILNLFPYWLPAKISMKILDTQFRSTVKYVIGLLLSPLYYLILFIPVWIFTEPAWIKWAFLVSLPLSGLFAHTWFIWFKKLRSLCKYQILTLRRNKSVERLKELMNQMVDPTDLLIPDPPSQKA